MFLGNLSSILVMPETILTGMNPEYKQNIVARGFFLFFFLFLLLL